MPHPAQPASDRRGYDPYAAMSSEWISGSKPVPWNRCGPRKCSQSGYASSAPATSAVTPSPAAIRGSAARASGHRAGCSAQTARNTPSASAVKNSPSAAIENAAATSSPSTIPPVTARPGRRSRNTPQISSGTSQPAVQFRCALACDTIAGQKAMNSAPTPAASRLRTRYRLSSQYQATAVAARLSVRITRNVAGGPIRYVSGAKTAAYTVIEVFTARFTPSGTLISVV